MPQVMMPEFIMAHFADMLEGNANGEEELAACSNAPPGRHREEAEVKQRCA